jgi:hypothetical protein
LEIYRNRPLPVSHSWHPLHSPSHLSTFKFVGEFKRTTC